MNDGIAPAIKQDPGEERESGWTRGLVIWKYAWTVLKDIAYLLLIYVAFGKMNSTFEVLVLALLIFIYQAVSNTLTLLLRTSIEQAHIQRGLFLGLYRHFKDPEAEQGEQELKKAIKVYHKTDGIWYINGITYSVAYFFVLWKTLSVTAFS